MNDHASTASANTRSLPRPTRVVRLRPHPLPRSKRCSRRSAPTLRFARIIKEDGQTRRPRLFTNAARRRSTLTNHLNWSNAKKKRFRNVAAPEALQKMI